MEYHSYYNTLTHIVRYKLHIYYKYWTCCPFNVCASNGLIARIRKRDAIPNHHVRKDIYQSAELAGPLIPYIISHIGFCMVYCCCCCRMCFVINSTMHIVYIRTLSNLGDSWWVFWLQNTKIRRWNSWTSWTPTILLSAYPNRVYYYVNSKSHYKHILYVDLFDEQTTRRSVLAKHQSTTE